MNEDEIVENTNDQTDEEIQPDAVAEIEAGEEIESVLDAEPEADSPVINDAESEVVETPAQEIEQAPPIAVEHRTFGRPSPDHPM